MPACLRRTVSFRRQSRPRFIHTRLMACEQTGARVSVAPIKPDGQLDLDQFESMLTTRTKVVSSAHVSNVLGVVYPVARIVEIAHARGILLVVNGAQGIPHEPVDVQSFGCDFYAFSGHKMYGPTGTGALYGRGEWIERIAPQEGGSAMAEHVSFEGWTPKDPPYRFEAGVPSIAEAIALGASLDDLQGLGMERGAAYEESLDQYATKQLAAIDRVRVLGRVDDRVSVVSFTVDGTGPNEVQGLLDRERGIEVRAGDQDAQPLMQFRGVPGVVRASLGFYNTREEIDALVDGVKACFSAIH
ncbi:MAG: cysteine desulfurase / selenocysteine lyase [Thermomicrobiales bacterium]|nr:cysteine desulfurase / selenocysteine lyase [Thermomicrobiales bacterium]